MAKSRKDLGSYWERRTREREEKWNRKCREQLERETARQYNAALRSIEKDIMALYGTFASDNGLTMQDARKLLHGQEFRQWRMGMKEYIEEIHHAEETGQLAKSAGLMRELNTLAMRSRISRLDKLRSETLMELDSLGRKRETAMGRFLADAYRDNYYRSLFEIGKEAGLKGSFAKADSKAVEDLLRTPWSGKNYSGRIWVDMRKLETTIRDSIVQGIHRGVSASKMTKAVMDRMNVSRSNAERLVRTELCYVQNQASLDSIRESGMGFYRVCAAFDKRTCTKCASKDGIEVPVDEASPGDTLPPFHARCRCSIIASFGDGKTSKGKRIARDSEGRNIKVPADMKYSDWKAVYVDGSKTLSEWNNEQSVHKNPLPGQGDNGIIKARKQQGSEEKIDWPKFDKSKVISKEQYRGLRDFANQNGIALSKFQRFDGNVEAIRGAIRSLAALQKEFPDVADARHRLTLVLDDTMDANDFAMTKGRHIHLNADAYRDLDRLKEEYRKLVEEGWFVKGTDWRAIVHHEFGHIVANTYGIDLMEIACAITEMKSVRTLEFVKQELSKYAGNLLDGSEIISEVFADLTAIEPTDFSKKFYLATVAHLKKEGSL